MQYFPTTKTSNSNPEDKVVWDLTSSGKFTVKSTYKHLLSKDISPPIWRNVWISNLLPKINFFLVDYAIWKNMNTR